MSSARYSLLGLARPRAPWFTDLGRWATAGTMPVDFVRCISAEEVRARLASDRPFSALLVDANVSGLDRDLVDVARSRGCITLVMADGGSDRDWTAIGAAVALPTPLERQTL
ncbi:MAG: hypothetical protein QOJ19_3492, partial [Acidimicrobiia bacterium]|nr:hypothetical protein [Acidimicrobiia bacterium]